jgi:hypothetical protein
MIEQSCSVSILNPIPAGAAARAAQHLTVNRNRPMTMPSGAYPPPAVLDTYCYTGGGLVPPWTHTGTIEVRLKSHSLSHYETHHPSLLVIVIHKLTH